MFLTIALSLSDQETEAKWAHIPFQAYEASKNLAAGFDQNSLRYSHCPPMPCEAGHEHSVFEPGALALTFWPYKLLNLQAQIRLYQKTSCGNS